MKYTRDSHGRQRRTILPRRTPLYAQYVAPMKNHIRATVTFNRRKQDAGEKFHNFVTDLRILVKDCGYAKENGMLRDAIVL